MGNTCCTAHGDTTRESAGDGSANVRGKTYLANDERRKARAAANAAVSPGGQADNRAVANAAGRAFAGGVSAASARSAITARSASGTSQHPHDGAKSGDDEVEAVIRVHTTQMASVQSLNDFLVSERDNGFSIKSACGGTASGTANSGSAGWLGTLGASGAPVGNTRRQQALAVDQRMVDLVYGYTAGVACERGADVTGDKIRRMEAVIADAVSANGQSASPRAP